MKQYTMKLDNTRQRPVVILNNGLIALLDTRDYAKGKNNGAEKRIL